MRWLQRHPLWLSRPRCVHSPAAFERLVQSATLVSTAPCACVACVQLDVEVLRASSTEKLKIILEASA